MSTRRTRLQTTSDVFLHMGDKAFFDNEYTMAPPSLIKGLENPYDRNGLHDMHLVREMCHRMEGEPIKDFMNPGAVDMRYAFGGGEKPGNPTPRVAEVYDHLLKQQQIIDFSDHNRHMQESLREIHTAGDVDLLNRALESGQIDTTDPRVLNNPLLNSVLLKMPKPGSGDPGALVKAVKGQMYKGIKDVTGEDLQKIEGDVKGAVNDVKNFVGSQFDSIGDPNKQLL